MEARTKSRLLREEFGPRDITDLHWRHGLASDAKVWLRGSDLHEGTWWTDLGVWLDERCGARRGAPAALGSHSLRVLAEAPGTYVFDK